MTGPRIAPVHVEFWHAAKATPRFARLLPARTLAPKLLTCRALIDRCVNAHSGPAFHNAPSKVRTVNTLALVRSGMKREPLRVILRRMAHSGPCPADPRRRANCRKWLARIERDNPEVLPAVYRPFGNPCQPN